MPKIQLPRQKSILLIILVLILLIIINFIFFKKVQATGYKIQPEDAIKGVTVSGTVESRHDVRLAASVTAKIKEIRYQEGQFVYKGQILAVLDRNEILGNLKSAEGQLISSEAQVTNPQTGITQAQVREAQSNIGVLQQQLQRSRVQLQDVTSQAVRYQALYRQGAISLREAESAENARLAAQQDVYAAQAQINAARARLTQARGQIRVAQGQVQSAEGGVESTLGRLENYTLRAPITGFVVEKILDKGEIVSPSAPVLRLVVPEYIYVSAQVEENQLDTVKLGQSAYIIFDAYPAKTFKGRVIEVSRDVNPITGTFEAKISIPNIGLPVIVGMTSDVTIVLEEIKNTLVIPREFVFTKDKKQYVFKKVGSKAAKTYVDGEAFDNNRFVATRGLKKGDIIVKGKTKKIQPNNRVNITEYYGK